MSLLVSFLLFPRGYSADLINSSVGQVGEQVITARQVWISSFFEHWSLARKSPDAKIKTPKPDWKPAIKSEAFNQAASSLMLESMVAQEAENFSVAQVDAAKVKSETAEFLKAMSGFSEWNQLEISEKEMEKFLEKKLRAQNFLKFKTDSVGVVISDEDAKVYFDKNRVKFGNLPFAQFRESIKEVLSRQMLEERLKDWFEILKRKYRVRFLGQTPA